MWESVRCSRGMRVSPSGGTSAPATGTCRTRRRRPPASRHTGTHAGYGNHRAGIPSASHLLRLFRRFLLSRSPCAQHNGPRVHYPRGTCVFPARPPHLFDWERGGLALFCCGGYSVVEPVRARRKVRTRTGDRGSRPCWTDHFSTSHQTILPPNFGKTTSQRRLSASTRNKPRPLSESGDWVFRTGG